MQEEIEKVKAMLIAERDSLFAKVKAAEAPMGGGFKDAVLRGSMHAYQESLKETINKLDSIQRSTERFYNQLDYASELWEERGQRKSPRIQTYEEEVAEYFYSLRLNYGVRDAINMTVDKYKLPVKEVERIIHLS